MIKKTLLLLLVGLTLIACKKEQGCTDPSAFNYNSEAEKDDESCTYNARAVCWFNSTTATNCVNASIPEIDFYIDGVKLGSVSMNQFSAGEPPCGGDKGITATLFIGYVTSISKTYSIKEGGTSNLLQSGTVLMDNKVCDFVEFTY